MPPLVQFGSSVNIDVVSIHPRLFRRGNAVHRAAWHNEPVSIHPRLFRRGNLLVLILILVSIAFQSTPAFSGEGTASIASFCAANRFQSTPAFSGEGTKILKVLRQVPRVSIHPRLFRRGNFGTSQCIQRGQLVSIHPRLFRRGNRPAASQ